MMFFLSKVRIFVCRDMLAHQFRRGIANFVIQRLNSPREMKPEYVDVLTRMIADEGWGPFQRPVDISHMYNGPPYVDAKIFLGFVDDKMIGHAASISGKDQNSTKLMEYLSLLILKKEFRGKGYGLKLTNALMETIDKASTSAYCDAAPNMVTKYHDRLGLNPEWDNREYIISLSGITEKYRVTKYPGNLSIKLLSEIEFDKFSKYDSEVYGVCRTALIRRWSTLPDSFTWVALNEHGDVVGYITIRESISKEELSVGPLYANNLEMAKKLLYTAAQAMSKLVSSAKNLRMLIPAGKSNANKMIENDFGIKCGQSFIRMSSKKPKVDLNRVIAINSPSFG